MGLFTFTLHLAGGMVLLFSEADTELVVSPAWWKSFPCASHPGCWPCAAPRTIAAWGGPVRSPACVTTRHYRDGSSRDPAAEERR